MLLALVGAGSLLAALALSGFGALVAFWSAGSGRLPLIRVARRALHLAAAGVGLASLALIAAFLSHDFVIAFVATHSNLASPTALLAAGFYGGQEGSLLYWTLIVAVIGSISIAGTAVHRVSGYATGVLATILTFFLLVLTLVANPFATLGFVPADGTGLNPILRDGGMLVHPPFLLAGFASFAIPFSFAMATLLAGRSDAAWIAQTRRLALLAWGLQSAGLTLGMWWAYHVLGWGGYWGWDPVENVALLPWLVTTAYIHSSQVQERRGMLKAWNHGLVIAAFLLAIFGTFVVRSGIIQSVHSFAISAIGPWFLGFLAAAVIASGLLLALRAPLLRPERELETSYSREGAFLLQNLLFLGLTLAVLWGTILPLVSQVTGHSAVVGAPFYERATGPLFLLLLTLLAVGPLVPWRRAGRAWLQTLRWPVTAAVASLAALLAGGVSDPAPLLAGPVLAAAATTSVLEWARGVRFAGRLPGPWPLAAVRLVARNRRRYGAYLAHLGIVVAAIGFAGSHFWQQERQVSLVAGQSISVGRYVLTLNGLHTSSAADSTASEAELVLGDGSVLRPGRVVYAAFGGQSSTQVAIRSTLIEDLYVVLTPSTGSGGSVNLTVFVNPLVGWIWTGAALLILGTIMGSWPSGRRSPALSGSPARSPALARGLEA